MNSPHLEIGDMSAGQESGSPIRENRTLLPAPLPPDEARGTLAAAAGVSTVGLRPPFDTPQRHSHPVCRAILTLIVALDTSLSLGEVPGYTAGDKHEIIAFDVGEGGALSNRRFFCQTDHGYPDGFAIDSRGWVWTTAADGVHIWSADRRKLGFIPTPAVASNCAFGGVDGRRLFIAATKYLLAIDLSV